MKPCVRCGAPPAAFWHLTGLEDNLSVIRTKAHPWTDGPGRPPKAGSE